MNGGIQKVHDEHITTFTMHADAYMMVQRRKTMSEVNEDGTKTNLPIQMSKTTKMKKKSICFIGSMSKEAFDINGTDSSCTN